MGRLSGVDRRKHALLTGPSGSGDIEGGAVVDRGAQDWQTDSHVHPGVKREQFHWDMA